MLKRCTLHFLEMNTIKFPRNRPVTLLGLIAFAFVGGVLVQRTEAQSTSEMRAIAAADYKKIDNELNVVYQKIIKSSNSRSAANLRAAQRAWITFRDAEAKYKCTDSEGGSMYPIDYNYALTNLTKQRIQQLRGSTSR